MDCPYRLHAPHTEEGWQALALLELCAGQVKLAQSVAVGLDLNAWLAAAGAQDYDPHAMTLLFPAAERGLVTALNASNHG